MLNQIQAAAYRCPDRAVEAEALSSRGGLARVCLALLPSFIDFAFLAPLLLVLVRPTGFQSLLGDGDTGWHLRAGEWMLRRRQIPFVDFFSFSKPGAEWFAWEWLWDVFFAGLEQIAGMAGVLLISVLFLCICGALIYSSARRGIGQTLPAAILALVAIGASSFHWLARPHLISFLFFIIFLRILDRERKNTKRILWELPVLMVFWTNLHAGFIVGLALVLTYFCGEALGWLAAPCAERAAKASSARLYGYSFLACLAATFVNPYFFRLHLHILGYLMDGDQMRRIGEFQSISFHNPLAFFFEILLLLGVGAAFWNLNRKRFTPALLIFSWAHLALVSGRNIPLYAIVATPLIAESLASWLAGWGHSEIGAIRAFQRALSRISANADVFEASPRFHLISVAVFGAVAAILYSPLPPPRFQARYDPAKFPVRAVEVLAGRNADGKIFSTDDWSGFVIYRIGSTAKVFIDGRSDFYGPAFEDRYSTIVDARKGWEDRLADCGADALLLPVGSTLSIALKASSRWVGIYDDGVAMIFIPTLRQKERTI